MCITLILSACATSTPTPVPTPVPITPTPAPTPVVIDMNKVYVNPWTLVGFGNPANPTVVPGGVTITLLFTPDGLISGFSGCNNYSGTVQVASDGTMTVGPIATTLMACAQGMDQETAYLAALQSAYSLSFGSQGRLVLNYGAQGATSQTMVFAVGAQPLTGTSWVLVSSGDTNAPTPVPAGVVITANFSQDGYMTGLSGCNQYNLPYTVQATQITPGPVAITQVTCPTGMDAEQAYLTALGTIQGYTITGPKLVITYNAGAGVLNYTSASLPLEYTQWALVDLNSMGVPTNTQITATFTPGETAGSGTIGGSSGCNTYSAGYSLNAQTLTVQQPAVTMMYCEGTIDTEQVYLQALQASTSYQIFADKLVLKNPSGSLTFTANRTPLTGALWALIALGDVKKPESPVKGSNFTAQFIRIPGAPSGVLNGTTGCNEYTTAFSASATEIKINTPVSTTNTSCAPGLTDQEKLYYLALTDASTYTITANTLILPYDTGKQALVFEGTQLGAAVRPPLSGLNGSTWYLWSIGNNAVLPGTTIYAQLAVNPDGASGSMNGSAGCNTYVATFGLGLGVQATLNATQSCKTPAGIMEQEASYMSAVSRAYGYWQTGDQLILNTGQGALTYRSTKPASSYDQTHLLVDHTWYLIAYNKSYSTPGTQEPFTTFNSDGTFKGYSGCNDFQGNFTTNIQDITVSNFNIGNTACNNGTLHAQEDNMENILKAAKNYQVSEDVMQIISDVGVLSYSLTPLTRTEVKPPTAEFSAPTEAPVNTVVTFDATESFSDVPIVYYEWRFGDGNSGAGQVVEHVYSVPGNYDVTLLVTDERGNQDDLIKRLTVFETAAPSPTPTTAPQPTATTAPTSQPQVTETAAPTQPPEPTPTTAPTEVPQAPPAAVIQGPASGYVGEPVTFDGSGSTAGSSPIATYEWNFGDGTTAGPSASPQVTTLYNLTGNFPVTLVVTDQNGLSSSATANITISARLNTPVVWQLDSYAGQAVLPGTGITLAFQAGQLAGFAGCNSYSGTYTATQNPDGSYTITSGGIVKSTLACPTDVMDQESRYLALLSAVTTAKLEANILTLTAPDGSLIYHQAGSVSVTPY